MPKVPIHDLNESHVKELEQFGGAGAKYDDIAQYYGMSRATFCRILERKPFIRDAIKRGKFLANLNVSQSLYNSATQDGNVTAMIFWLKTQFGWREKQEIDLNVNRKDQEKTREELIEEILKLAKRNNLPGAESEDPEIVH